MKNSHGPCLDNNCSWCCDPVKIFNKDIIQGRQLPKKEDGSDMWIRRDEVLVPAESPDTKINTYDCVNFDRTTGRCLDYENRPNECRSTSCLNLSRGTDKEKFDKITGAKFIPINPIKFK